MRIDLKKFLFVGLEKDKTAFFQAAQELGVVHFIPSKKGGAKQESQEVEHYTQAIKILNSLPAEDQEELDIHAADNLVEEILELKGILDNLIEQEKALALEIQKVSPFGSYSSEDIKWIEKESGCHLQFFCAKQGFAMSDRVPEEAIFIDRDNGLEYFIVLSSQPKQYENMIEIRPEAPLDVLQGRLRLLQQEIDDKETEIKFFAKYNVFLHQALIEKYNSLRLGEAEEWANLAIDDKIFAVEGWVPETQISTLKQVGETLHIHIEPIAIESNETVPTYLENEGLSKLGEDLVNIYDTPSNKDKDPSLWVLFFFAIFFSMIIGDGGYGLVLLLAALYARMKSSSLTKTKMRFINLTMILGGFCLVWGLLTTSFFGITFAPDSPIRKVSVLTWLAEKKAEYHFDLEDNVYQEWIAQFPALQGLKDPKQIFLAASSADPITGDISYEMLGSFTNDILLEFALFIGVIHICLSFIRNLNRNLAGLGWIIFIAGCYLYFPTFLSATSLIHYVFGINPIKGAEAGVWMIFGGMSLAVAIGMIKDKLFGILECMNILQIFGDVMSYLRLYALGLSGALVVNTTNELASGLPLIFAILVLVLAHGINLVLCIMGGVIHGLRLNFLEWYHYCFEGGGKLFNPLRKIEVE